MLISPRHIDDFYYSTSEILCRLYASFPVRSMLLVEDISGPIKWDMTGLPDRKSTATFETIVWLADHGLMTFRSVEPRDIGVEGAVLTQNAFVLLTGSLTWEDGTVVSRIEGLLEARRSRAYADLGTIVKDMFLANSRWAAPSEARKLEKSEPMSISDEKPGDPGVS